MSLAPTVWFTVAAVPSRLSAPAPGRVRSITSTSTSPVSVSAKPKSAALKVWVASSASVSVLSAAVGAVLAASAARTTPVGSLLSVSSCPLLLESYSALATKSTRTRIRWSRSADCSV